MKFFVGVVPPPGIYEQLQHIQTQFGDNRLEPHVTIRPPVTVLHLAPWVQAIEDICATVEPFGIQLPGTGFFGDRVLFVSVQSPGLTQLHNLFIPALQIFEKEEISKNEAAFHPHLTLGRKWCGFTTDDFAAMKLLVDEYLQASFVWFTVTQIRIYYKPDNHGRFETYRDISLNNNGL
ncbi:2'-5' RNA ligase family protein [Mucilaginibacter sp. CSA2-8R]|uniref:2'-5' RNA ligase family protein n=1 Tax=Mucilaginibacter sp. CSA2-8R TaxID=3141542 RepID=UPI00315C8C48